MASVKFVSATRVYAKDAPPGAKCRSVQPRIQHRCVRPGSPGQIRSHVSHGCPDATAPGSIPTPASCSVTRAIAPVRRFRAQARIT